MLELSERQSLVSCTITRQCKTKYLTWNNFLSGFDFADNQFCQHFGPIVFADTKAVARKKPYKKHKDHIPSYKIKTFTHCTALLYFFEKKSNKNHKYNCCLLFPVHFHSKEIFPEFRGASSRLNFPDRKLISCGFYAVFPVDYTSWRKANPMKFPKYNPPEN